MPTANPQTNRVDILANRLQTEGKIDQLEAELLKLSPASLTENEKEAWHQLYGIMAFRAGNRELAFKRFRDGLQDCPTSKLLKFSLGQEYEFQGDVENMLSCFDEAQFPEAPSSHVICEARYAYLWGRFDKAASYVRPILTAYWQVRVLDDHFLYIRGLPFFGQVWAYFAAFARLTGNYAELEAITDRARANCSDFDFEALIADLGAFRTGNYDAIKRKLQDAIQQAQQSRWPTGYQRVKLAVLNGQDAASYSDAKRILDSVVLEKNDFQWLTDILLLAACEAARKHGHGDKEAELVGRFMARQPLLFEPNHAVNFNLLGYQETLKIRYQATRQPSR